MTALPERQWTRYIDSWGPWAALSTLAIVLALGVRSTVGLFGNIAWVEHTHRVIESLKDLRSQLTASMAARRAFSLTGDAEQLDNYARAIRGLTDATRTVRALTSDNPDQQRRLDSLEPLLAGRIARMDAALERRARGFNPDREAQDIRDGTAGYRVLSDMVDSLTVQEQHLLRTRERSMAASVLRTKATEAVGACIGMALIGVVVVRLRREVRRRELSEQSVRRSEDAIRHLNEDLERRVDERTAELKLANRELESFSYSVVHDLRAPLRGIGGFAEVLLEEYADTLSPEAKDCLREIHQNARQMALLIDALVSMSKITREVLRPTRVDVTALVRAVARRLASGADSGSRPAVIDVSENLWADVDPLLARTLIEILLGNSWKFTGNAAAPRIEVGANEVAGQEVLFVRDNGVGFDMAQSDKLFSPFGRLHTVAEFPGLGIGLATAQRIIQRHGGRIWAEAHVGEGAVFYFTLGPTVGGRMTT